MSAQLVINQAGLAAGVPNQARSDGLSTGAEVTLTSVGAGLQHDFELLWAPEDDATAFSTFQKINGTTATFSPDSSSVGGTYRIKLTVIQDTGPSEVIRCFSILTSQGLRIPALNERANEAATLTTGPSLAQDSEFNEPAVSGPFQSGNYGGWYSALADLMRYVDTISGGGGSGDVTGPGSSTDGNIVVFDGATGKIIQDSGESIADILNDASTTAAILATSAAQSQSNIRTALSNAAGPIDVNGQKIVDLVDPTNPQDAATKAYVDLVAGGGGGSGDVVGPASSVDDRIVTFDGITGKLIQDSGVTVAGLQSYAVTQSQTFSNVNSALATANASLDVNAQKIIDLADPTNPQDAATKNYVDVATGSAAVYYQGYSTSSVNAPGTSWTSVHTLTPLVDGPFSGITRSNSTFTFSTTGYYRVASCVNVFGSSFYSGARLRDLVANTTALSQFTYIGYASSGTLNTSGYTLLEGIFYVTAGTQLTLQTVYSTGTPSTWNVPGGTIDGEAVRTVSISFNYIGA